MNYPAARIIAISILATTPANAAAQSVQFEGLTPGTIYNNPSSIPVFEQNLTTIDVLDFTLTDDTIISTGFAEVGSAQASGATGNDLGARNANLRLNGLSQTGIWFKFGDLGGNVNLEINGDFRNVNDLIDLHGDVVGGHLVQISMTTTTTGLFGTVNVDQSSITSLIIGGQNLWIDDFGLGIPTSATLTPLAIAAATFTTRRRRARQTTSPRSASLT